MLCLSLWPGPGVLADEASVGEFVDAAERHAHSDGGDHEPVLQRVYKGGTMGLWLMSAHVVLHQLNLQPGISGKDVVRNSLHLNFMFTL